MSGFGILQRKIVDRIAVWYLRQKNLGSMLEAVALVLDGAMDNLYQGARLAYPYRCRPEGLLSLALDRGIRLYDTEPDASKRYRLAHWWQLWKQKGSHQGEMRHLQPYFLGADGKGVLPRIRIVHQSGGPSPVATWHTLSGTQDPGGAGRYSWHVASPSNFDFDAQGTASATPLAPAWAFLRPYALGAVVTNDGGKLYVCITPGTAAASGGPTGDAQDITDGTVHWRRAWPWARWWAFIELDPGSVQALTHYDDGSLYDGGSYYDGIPSAVGDDMVSMLRDWKAAHSSCWGVAVTTVPMDPTATPVQDADGWWSLPNATWGHLIDVTTHKATRPPYITWLLDRSQP